MIREPLGGRSRLQRTSTFQARGACEQGLIEAPRDAPISLRGATAGKARFSPNFRLLKRFVPARPENGTL
jgi:hypothetical protein